eukprot:gene19917-biopygen26299
MEKKRNLATCSGAGIQNAHDSHDSLTIPYITIIRPGQSAWTGRLQVFTSLLQSGARTTTTGNSTLKVEGGATTKRTVLVDPLRTSGLRKDGKSLPEGLGRRGSVRPATKGAGGIMDSNCANNPDFCNFNRVYMAYCDGNSFSGNRDEAVVVGGKPLYFRGR